MSGHYTKSIKKPSKIDAKSINKSSKIEAKSIKNHQNWTKNRKRRFYENERLAYTKHSFSWFQDMLLESKVRVQINVCCFSYCFCFAIRFSSFFIDCGFQNHFLKPWKWVFRVSETLIFIKSPFFDFNQKSYKIHPTSIQNQPKNTPKSMPKSIKNHQKSSNIDPWGDLGGPGGGGAGGGTLFLGGVQGGGSPFFHQNFN